VAQTGKDPSQVSNRSMKQQNPTLSQTVKATTVTAGVSTFDLKRKAREKQYEKIKEYAVQFNVDEAMIYALLSEYKSMQKIKLDSDPYESSQSTASSEHHQSTTIHHSKKKKMKIARGLDNANKTSIDNDLLIVEAPTGQPANDESGSQQDSNSQLINMKTYLHFSVFKRLLHYDVLARIL